MGHIFVTGDSKTYGWPHGHAGIGTATVGATIEVANTSLGVVYRANRVTDYWSKKNSSIMGVVGSTSSNYTSAFTYANNRIGKAYGFDPLNPNDFYCSELVFLAWKNAGITLYNHTIVFILLSSIYGAAKIYTVVKYGTGY